MTCFNSDVSIVGITDKIIQNISNIQFCAIQWWQFTLEFVIRFLKIYNIFVMVVYNVVQIKSYLN